jgi:hypothetical protein
MALIRMTKQNLPSEIGHYRLITVLLALIICTGCRKVHQGRTIYFPRLEDIPTAGTNSVPTKSN